VATATDTATQAHPKRLKPYKLPSTAGHAQSHEEFDKLAITAALLYERRHARRRCFVDTRETEKELRPGAGVRNRLAAFHSVTSTAASPGRAATAQADRACSTELFRRSRTA
jgi:hypothetical protein